jgi:hypothetical protein
MFAGILFMLRFIDVSRAFVSNNFGSQAFERGLLKTKVNVKIKYPDSNLAALKL